MGTVAVPKSSTVPNPMLTIKPNGSRQPGWPEIRVSITTQVAGGSRPRPPQRMHQSCWGSAPPPPNTPKLLGGLGPSPGNVHVIRRSPPPRSELSRFWSRDPIFQRGPNLKHVVFGLWSSPPCPECILTLWVVVVGALALILARFENLGFTTGRLTGGVETQYFKDVQFWNMSYSVYGAPHLVPNAS
jgi:hypothetical protein